MKKVLRGLLIVAAVTFCAASQAQPYPSMSIKIIVPYSAGSSTDVVGRLAAEMLRLKWGQAVVVENRIGAGGNIGAETVAKAPPDGYTLFLSAPGPFVVNKSLFKKLSYDPDTFVPISVVVASPNVLMVHPSVPVTTVKELIAFAKANPGQVNFASPGNGTTGHLAGELFKSMGQINIVHVPYKGGLPALTDLLAGRVQMMFLDLGAALPHVKANKVRALAVGSERRSAALPDVPAVSEVLPEFVSTTWFAMAAPAGTPSAIADALSHAIREGLKREDIAKKLRELRFDLVGSTPDAMKELMQQESERAGKLIRQIGITAG